MKVKSVDFSQFQKSVGGFLTLTSFATFALANAAFAADYDSGKYDVRVIVKIEGKHYVAPRGLAFNKHGLVVGNVYNQARNLQTGMLAKGEIASVVEAPISQHSLTFNDVNDEGIIIGSTRQENPWPMPNPEFGVVYQNGEFTRLQPLISGGETISGAINYAGQIVGTAYTRTRLRPVIWDKRGNLLTELPCDGRYGRATEISDTGVVAGQCNDLAAIWSGGTIRSIGVLPNRGHDTSFPTGINKEGTAVIGRSKSLNGPLVPDGNFLFLTARNEMVELPDLEEARSIVPTAINNKLEIVGKVVMNSLQWDRGFIFKNGTYTLLQDLVEAEFPYLIGDAIAISDQGEILAQGSTFPNTYPHVGVTLLLTPRE